MPLPTQQPGETEAEFNLRLDAAKRHRADMQRQWNDANRETRNAYSAKWREANRAFVNAGRARKLARQEAARLAAQPAQVAPLDDAPAPAAQPAHGKPTGHR